jgi:GT2 family glycosyltransferase
MIDDDIIPSIGRPAWYRNWVAGARNINDTILQRHVLHRLIGSGKTLVAGAYFGRQEGGALMCANTALATQAKSYEDRVVEVDWVGTGCMLIHRRVFEDIRAKFGDSLKINVPDYDYDYFRPFDSAHGEDVSFCLRAKDAGHQPHIDLGIPVFHVGFKTY